MLTIAGSGPSCQDYNQKVTVATKKRSLPSDYIFCRFAFHHERWGDGLPLMLYYTRCWCGQKGCIECGVDPYRVDSKKWNDYYSEFVRSKRPPQKTKPSLGCCAVMGVYERWKPDEIGLIGFDWILDGNEKWGHDAVAERACIESLVRIVDLRQ